MKHIPMQEIQDFRCKIQTEFYGEGGRKFPWRYHTDPYAVLVSEFMLQQTQTSRVIPYFERFMKALPGLESLSQVSIPVLLELWQGLGYNRRALFLRQTAQQIMDKHCGLIPGDIQTLIRLPGIGVNTAGAIVCFAFDLPVAFLETNIKAALIHDFFPDETTVSDKDLLELSNLVMDRDHPRQWYYALVDYGVQIKKNHANPTRKSKTYQKQSTFKGSLRQFRGSILRQLLAKGNQSADQLLASVKTDLGSTDAEVQTLYKKALDKLLAEEMVSEKEGIYRPGPG